MPWTLDILPEPNLLDLRVFGRFSLEDARRLVQEGGPLIQVREVRHILADITDVEPCFSVLDIFQLPRIFLNHGIPRSIRTAVLLPQQKKTDYSFYETVCANLGYHVRAFPFREEAIQWFTESNAA